jgi:hypothetical protein
MNRALTYPKALSHIYAALPRAFWHRTRCTRRSHWPRRATDLDDITGRVMLGQLSDGCQRDHGRLAHAVEAEEGYSSTPALCGAAPGRRSVGWSPDAARITCPRCLAKLRRLEVSS